MIVSWNWLKDYLPLDVPVEEFERRLMMAGLNHESTVRVDDDVAIDLEVTSNRPDCLGHVGIAREAAVLFELPLVIPPAMPPAGKDSVAKLARVRIDAPELCTRYTARVVREVQVGPSPAWLAKRLTTIGVAPINNVVDVTNYVLFECGQPLHAFDYARLDGGEIIVREPRPGETIEAIDHKTYNLSSEMCVIADASRAVAIGGVMGGAATEVSPATKDVLIEAAAFNSASIRATARKLNLHSDSSYRFERGVDVEAIDWASRRACELILQLAGGELAADVIDVGQPPAPRPPITLRFAQLKRILGIEVPPDRVAAILTALGAAAGRQDRASIVVAPPSWRRDLTREIDLVEEVARVHGYDQIPEDVSVPMAASARGLFDRVTTKTRQSMTAAGYDEAYTLSAVDEAWSSAFSPWTDEPAIKASTPILRGAAYLRRSLVPSLLGARRTNESLANPVIELFEIAKAYLPRQEALPVEEWLLALASGGDFRHVRGTIELLLAETHAVGELIAEPFSHPLFEAGSGARLFLGKEPFGFLGEVSAAGRKEFELRRAATVAELRLAVLENRARLVPQYSRPPQFPAIEQDLNIVVPESVRWAELEAAVRAVAGPRLEAVVYRDTYRDPERLGAGRKSQLFSLVLRDPATTLTGEQAEEVRRAVVTACREKLGGELRE